MAEKIILTPEEHIQFSIQLGESHFREFKSALEGLEGRKKPRELKSICRDVSENLVSFANADGGVLLLGVEDDGIISGVIHNEHDITILKKAYITHVNKDTPLPEPKIYDVTINGKKVLFFSINKGNQYCYQTSDGRCLQRHDKENVPMAVEKIEFKRREEEGKQYDRQYADDAFVYDLDMDILRNVVSELLPESSPEKCLEYLDLADFSTDRLRIRNAAVLLFMKKEKLVRWAPKNELRIIKINGTELKTGEQINIKENIRVYGNIIEILETIWDYVNQYITERKYKEGFFKEARIYPVDAIHEAIINAVAHRNYAITGVGIEIRFYDDRLEIQSPGALLSTININDIKSQKGVHESRNSLICRVLRELGYMQELGEGMRRIYSLIKQNDLIPPLLDSGNNYFNITIFNKSIFSQTDQYWLDSYSNYDLTREEKIVLMLGKNGRLIAPSEIRDSLDIIDTKDYTDIITKMIDKGLLFNAMNKYNLRKIAKSRGVDTNTLPRFKIRSSKECDEYLTIFYNKLTELGLMEYYNRDIIIELKNILPIDNIYNKEWVQLLNILKLFQLINENLEPTEKLKIIIQSKKQTGITDELDKLVQKISSPKTLGNFEIYLYGINNQMTEKDLEKIISKYGRIKTIDIPKGIYEYNRGYAFITMHDKKDAENMLNKLNDYEHLYKIWKTNWSKRAILND